MIAQGRQLQEAFFAGLFRHTDEEMRAAFFATLDIMEKNLDAMLEEAR